MSHRAAFKGTYRKEPNLTSKMELYNGKIAIEQLKAPSCGTFSQKVPS